MTQSSMMPYGSKCARNASSVISPWRKTWAWDHWLHTSPYRATNKHLASKLATAAAVSWNGGLGIDPAPINLMVALIEKLLRAAKVGICDKAKATRLHHLQILDLPPKMQTVVARLTHHIWMFIHTIVLHTP